MATLGSDRQVAEKRLCLRAKKRRQRGGSAAPARRQRGSGRVTGRVTGRVSTPSWGYRSGDPDLPERSTGPGGAEQDKKRRLITEKHPTYRTYRSVP